MEEHLLGGRERVGLAVTQQDMEHVQALVVRVEHLRRHVHTVAGLELAQVREVRLDGEVAAAALEVVGVDPQSCEQRVCGVCKELEVPALVNVPVVVDPLRRNASHRTCARGAQQPSLPGCEGRAGGRFLGAEGLQEPDEHPVPQPLELARREPARLCVRLGGDRFHQLVGQLGNVGQVRPRPLERRPELAEEVAHSLLAAGDAVGEEGAHERPAQAGAVADRVVDLLDRRDPVVHEPERLAPERLEQPVGEEAVDLAADDERVHPHRAEHRLRAFDRLRRRPLARAELDERE